MMIKIKKILHKILSSKEKNVKYTSSGNSSGVQNVNFEGKNGFLDRCNFSGKVDLGYATTLGINNVLHGQIEIGKYCQIGFDVALHASNHPINFLTTYINKNLFDGELKKLKISHKIIIGNDVWIGHNAILIGDLRVGNGAIIAAGAVVTKDVPAYSIVAGVPAKVVKFRFNDSLIKELEELKWWDKSQSELEEIKHLFVKDLSNATTIFTNEI